jgi:hypothetical protein
LPESAGKDEQLQETFVEFSAGIFFSGLATENGPVRDLVMICDRMKPNQRMLVGIRATFDPRVVRANALGRALGQERTAPVGRVLTVRMGTAIGGL